MATIGRSRAVARIGKLKLSGFLAWLAWLLLHIVYLTDFRNRLVVLFDWAWSYFTYQRGSRLITGRRLEPGAPASIRPELRAERRPEIATAPVGPSGAELPPRSSESTGAQPSGFGSPSPKLTTQS
jgi:NADH dehydrogenase